VVLILAALIWALWFSEESAHKYLINDADYKRVCNSYKPSLYQPAGIRTIDEIVGSGIFEKAQ
jgi:hypothetical protein